MTVLYSRGQEQERKQLEQEIAAEMDTENQNVAMEEETEADQVASILKPQTQSTETAEVEKESEEADSGQEEAAPTGNTSQALHFAAEDGILWPMEGNVILDYSMDSTVYFATLDQYKYNPAVIIAGDVNSKVYAVAKGKIQSIETNEVTGCTVTEDLGDGYLAVYGQLKEPEFAVGDYVEAGHVIGYVTEPTKYYSVEGSNLYFELRKDGVPVDPLGREKGILHGANVVMPNLSPVKHRKDYSLYDNKICTGDEAAQCIGCLADRMKKIGYEIVTDRGDYTENYD